MFRYTGVNHNPLKFIKQVSIGRNIGKKICIDCITSSIGEVYIMG